MSASTRGSPRAWRNVGHAEAGVVARSQLSFSAAQAWLRCLRTRRRPGEPAMPAGPRWTERGARDRKVASEQGTAAAVALLFVLVLRDREL